MVPGPEWSPVLKNHCAGVVEIAAAGFGLSLQGKGHVASICQKGKGGLSLPDCLHCSFTDKIALCFKLFHYTVFAMML